MGCIFHVDIWQNSQLTRERLEWGWPVQLILEERFLAWLALVMIFTCPDNMESQRALESLKSLGGFGCYCFNTDLIWWGTVVEEIDPDNKHCPYKRWLKFEDYIFGGWWFLIGYVELCGSIYTRKLNIHFAPRNFSFVVLGTWSWTDRCFLGGDRLWQCPTIRAKNWWLPFVKHHWQKGLGLTSIGTCSLRCRNRHARK